MDCKRVIFCFFLLVSASSLFDGASAATFNVGDTLGWTFPPLGDIAYRTWAAQQSFTVGDTLVFNFTAGSHNVAEVSKTNYDACSSQTLMLLSTITPSNIKLNTAEEHYYICTFPGHCGAGMKLAINVSAATTTTPAPVSVPTSPPSTTTPTTHVVGDGLGWLVPPGGPIAYQTWANKNTFIVGDKLIFNFTSGAHNVAQLTSKADYDSCNTGAASNAITTSPASITLTTPGEHFYLCTFPQHCFFGQKLAINVTGTSSSSGTSPPGSSTSTPSSSSPGGSVNPPPSSAPIIAVAALPFTLLAIVFTLFY